ncbi:MAG: polysaccharide biosynthesis tyrosine autokinase [Propionibacteriaceae bacterium]|nr:polysaccharide biosynthesis tyrosine autokinase [Propionibacteriaceae bacterium]
MDLREFLGMLLKHWITVCLCLVFGVGGGLAATFLMTPQYQATSELYFSARTPGGQSGTSDAQAGGNYARQAVLSYVRVVTTGIVLDKVVDQLDLDMTSSQLASHISAVSPTNTVLITVTVTDVNPQRAADIANAVARVMTVVVPTDLEKPDANTPDLMRVTITQRALVPVNPSSPKPVLNLAVGLVAGLAVGVGGAWIRATLDTRLRSMEEIRNCTGAPLLGTIPFDPEAPSRPLIVQEEPRSPAAEEYRGLRTNIVFTNVGGKSQCLVVSSANPGEGKSTTTSNLAIALADSGARVVLIDCDFRRPALARYMRIEGGAGLSDILVGRAEPVDVLQRWGGDNLFVLPAGRVPPNPSELLGSVMMQDLIGFLMKTFDYVLVDSPPLLVATDAVVLSKVADGVMLVAGYDSIRRPQLLAAVNALAMVNSRLLGTILTKVPPKKIGSFRSGYSYIYGYGYGYGYGPDARKGERNDHSVEQVNQAEKAAISLRLGASRKIPPK